MRPRAACGLQRVASLQLCVAYIAVTHYKIGLIKKWPSTTELLAITDECVGVGLCVYLHDMAGVEQDELFIYAVRI